MEISVPAARALKFGEGRVLGGSVLGGSVLGGSVLGGSVLRDCVKALLRPEQIRAYAKR